MSKIGKTKNEISVQLSIIESLPQKDEFLHIKLVNLKKPYFIVEPGHVIGIQLCKVS